MSRPLDCLVFTPGAPFADWPHEITRNTAPKRDPISGQFGQNFDTRKNKEKLRFMPERSAEDWYALALQYEADPQSHPQAIDAYRHVLAARPKHVDALINLGMLSYEQGDLENASACFLRAVKVEPDNAVGHFNLGSVLDELAQLELARQHLRIAVRLDPRYADAHYYLAFVCDKLGSSIEARQHWQLYIQLEPSRPRCAYPRQRLAMPLD